MQYELIPKYLGQMHHYTSFLYKLHLPKGSLCALLVAPLVNVSLYAFVF